MFGLTFEPRSCCPPSKAAASSASRLRRVIIANAFKSKEEAPFLEQAAMADERYKTILRFGE